MLLLSLSIYLSPLFSFNLLSCFLSCYFLSFLHFLLLAFFFPPHTSKATTKRTQNLKTLFSCLLSLFQNKPFAFWCFFPCAFRDNVVDVVVKTHEHEKHNILSNFGVATQRLSFSICVFKNGKIVVLGWSFLANNMLIFKINIGSSALLESIQ